MHKVKIFKYVLVAMVLPCCMVEGKTDAPYQEDFRHRLSKLHARIDAVSDALKGIDGFPKKAGLIDLQVARFFAGYIAWELEHPELRDIQWDKVEYQDGFFRIGGEPVFFGGFNMLLSMGVTDSAKFPKWAGKDKENISSFLPKMRKIGVGILAMRTASPHPRNH